VRLARLSVGVVTVAFALLGAAGAQAVQASGSDQETARLRAQGEELTQKSRSAELELYALESKLGQAQTRLAGLRAESRSAARREAQERAHLVDAKRNLADAEAQLGARLRELYIAGDPDPLSILFGAESLSEAMSTLDSLDRFASQDVRIVAQVKAARAELGTSVATLAAETNRLEALTAEASRTESALRAARDERRAYLERIARAKNLNRSELAELTKLASTAEEKNDSVGGGAPSVPSAPSGPGTRMTVQATGYALPGTTATGIPVGWGVVAVDPSVIPLGTRMFIPGYGEGVAADTGSAVRGRIIDLWFPTRAQALAWGRRTVTITIH
jgi:3D (Asp-Asp-Asp) domain-containing protein/peptidoglycan hydrolase CwlO-like protein